MDQIADAEAPAFDTNTLSRPTPRKLVCCWMEGLGLPTTILPEVWDELTKQSRIVPERIPIVESWHRIRAMPDVPFQWRELDADERRTAKDVLEVFTQACFRNVSAAQIPSHSDAIIIAEAVATGAEILVSGDINSIDHYEVNGVLSQATGRNHDFVTTLDAALCKAHPCGDAAEHLLILALATIAPPKSRTWTLDDAHQDFQRFRKALEGAHLVDLSARLDARWEQSRDLGNVLDQAQEMAHGSASIAMERSWTRWLKERRETQTAGTVSRS